ncbi:MAG: capsular polysaccharide biosynthesis protein [Ruminococcaceae bacterium]|nr:capsular polysaccharide biosynthesis protein [Oscillospiraceae bacterium]
MLDFHTHILPGVDDGSQGVDESMQMLERMQGQGIETVVATPHFYANDESVDDFLARREAALRSLEERPEGGPDIVLGAEVRYYEGISRMPDLNKLRIRNSRLLLLEMPFRPWTEYAVKEVIDIACQGRITPVLAHVERYLFLQKKGVAARLLESGVLFQANSSFLTGWRGRRQAMNMIRKGQIHFIGSDCHNLTDRPPNAAEAFSLIEKKLGKPFATAMIEYERELLLHSKEN